MGYILLHYCRLLAGEHHSHGVHRLVERNRLMFPFPAQIVNEQPEAPGGIVAHPGILKKENIKGARRPLRMHPQNASIGSGEDDLAEFLELRFDLPAGSYATVLLREFLKQDVS